MHDTPTIEPTGSPPPGAIPDPARVRDEALAAHHRLAPTVTATATGAIRPASLPAQRNPARIVLAKLLSVLRGDKYMANAYPPAWHNAGDRTDRHDGELAAGASAVVSPTKER